MNIYSRLVRVPKDVILIRERVIGIVSLFLQILDAPT